MGPTRRALLAALAAASSTPLAWAADDTAEVVCPLPVAPSGLIPGVSNGQGTRLVGAKIYRGLMRWDADGTLQPDLARTIDLSAEGLTYTVRLQPGVTWHDGGGLDAGDVAFSITRFHRALQPRLGLDRVSVATPDDLTAVLTLDAPDDAFLRCLDALTLPIVPQHVHDRPGWALDPRQTAPVGAGPFRFDGWLRLVRFEWYAGPKPSLGAISFPIMPDPAARLALALADKPMLLAGDAVELSSIAHLRSVPALAVESDASPAAATMAGLLLNPAANPLGQAEVRLGLACAIDRDEALRSAWAGLGRVATGPAVASSLNRDDAATLPDHSPRAAAEHFNAAGLRPDDDGVRTRLQFLYPPGVPWQVLFLVLRQSLQQVGIELDAAPVPPAEWARRVAAGDYQVTGFVAGQTGDPARDLLPYAAGLPEVIARLRAGADGEREAQALLVARMPVLWLVEPALPIVRSRRLVLHGSALGNFDDAHLV
jgi:peptide/nickel transport system substrate-binding protein